LKKLGFNQPQGHVQVLLNIMLRGMTAQDALDLPRFCIGSGTPDGSIYIEEGVKPEVIQSLIEKGHHIVILKGHDRSMFGRGQIIQQLIDSKTLKRVLAGGAMLSGPFAREIL
jgi:gamma-glutamyltranspeptidase/glutathione hydrolase